MRAVRTILAIFFSVLGAGILLKLMKLGQNNAILAGCAVLVYASAACMYSYIRLHDKNTAGGMKRKITVCALFGLAFALSLAGGFYIHHSGNLYGGAADVNYMTGFGAPALFLWLAGAAVITPLAFAAGRFCFLIQPEPLTEAERRLGGVKWTLLLGLLIFLCWLPYLLSYYPGLIYGDSLSSVGQALGKRGFSNHHPIAYTMFIKLCLAAGYRLRSMNFGCAIYTAAQMLYISMLLAAIVCWLRRRGVSRLLCGFTTAFYALSPVFPIHAVSMWKDGIFSVTLAVFSLCLYEAAFCGNERLNSPRFLIKYSVFGLILCFSRNNGIYVLFFAAVCTGCLMLLDRQDRRNKKAFFLCSLGILLVTYLITGPLYKRLGVESSFEESVGIPLNQMARVAAYDGDYNASEEEFLNRLMPIEKYEEAYTPCCVDNLKWHADFNLAYLREHKAEFLKNWLSVGMKNPVEYIKGWSLMTFGYWAANCWEFNFQENNLAPLHDSEEFGIKQWDVFSFLSGRSLRGLLPLKGAAVAPALVMWLMLFACAALVGGRRTMECAVFLPCIGAWLTLLIASPYAYWLRYLLCTAYMTPVVAFMLIYKGGKRER